MKLWRGQPDGWAWKPTGRDIARAWIGLGVIFLLLALHTLWFPSASSRTGRWRWLIDVFLAAFGPQGQVVLYSIIAAAFLFFGIRKYRATSGNNVD